MIRSSSRGFALIVTLGIVAIVSVLLVSFLVSMQFDRKTTSNYSQSIKAEEIGLGALQEVASGLVQEMDAGSKRDDNPAGSIYTVSGTRIYIPQTNASAVPARIGYSGTQYGTDVSANNLPPTLIRVSRDKSDPFYAAPSPTDYNVGLLPTVYASLPLTTSTSANGRSISPARWNKPLFMSGTAATVPTAFTANPPQWIYLTRSGSRVCTDAEAKSGVLNADPSCSNTNAVLGRYAYVIYDEGAVLDVNVAGADQPATQTPSFSGKSFVSYADLTQIPGLSQPLIDGLIAWRNQSALSTCGGNYNTVVAQGATNGFLCATSTATSNDNPLFGRQDLINYFKTVVGNTGAVPYLGTFSRAVNAPSWCPQTPAGSTIDYGALAETSTSANLKVPNRNVPNIRGATGAPLIQTRFPLSFLALLTHTATATATDPIYKYFGLTRSTGTTYWTYNHGSAAGNIYTLWEVARLGRQPDFFELLKAAILNGSLGRGPGAVSPGTGSNVQGPVGDVDGYSTTSDIQIIRIGANIIDQARNDNYPTWIYLAAHAVTTPESILWDSAFGQKDLPSLVGMGSITFAYPTGATWTLGAWLQPKIWNLNQEPLTYPAASPTQFQMTTYGSAETEWINTYPTWSTHYSTSIDYSATPSLGRISFTGSSGSFRDQPTMLTTSNASSVAANMWDSSQYNSVMYAGIDPFVGICSGPVDYNPIVPVSGTNTVYLLFKPIPLVSFILQYKDGNGNWFPYTQMARYGSSVSNSVRITPTTTAQSAASVDLPQCYVIRPDPRTDRFSCSESYTSLGMAETDITNMMAVFQSSMRPNSTFTKSNFIYKYFPRETSGFSYLPTSASSWTGSSKYYLGGWEENIAGTANSSSYKDPDGVTRPADGWRNNAAGATGDGFLLYHTASANPVPGVDTTSAGRRPVILNRPFYSVGELGYAYRDLPFKTLDFWSPYSADAALLDFFCLEQPSTVTGTTPAIVAGEVSLNHAPIPVLKAILAGAAKKEISIGTATPLVLSNADVNNLAPAIAGYIQTTPLLNRADLVTSTSSTTNLSAIINNALTATADKANKAYGEAPVRALSSVANTRTWNLMIDVIAQSGRMTPTPQSLNNFLVEGEKRYWLHIAIDRYTGKVIDQQLEPCYE